MGGVHSWISHRVTWTLRRRHPHGPAHGNHAGCRQRSQPHAVQIYSVRVTCAATAGTPATSPSCRCSHALNARAGARPATSFRCTCSGSSWASASYLLIGFWSDRPSAAAAAKKAFLVTRLRRRGLHAGHPVPVLQPARRSLSQGLNVFVRRSGTSTCSRRDGELAGAQIVAMGSGVATWVALGIFAGAVGKSAQFPLARMAAGRDGRPHTG